MSLQFEMKKKNTAGAGKGFQILKRGLAILVMAILSWVLLPLQALALETVTVTNEVQRDISLVIFYEGAQPNVMVTDPNGKSYGGKEDFTGYDEGETTLYLYLENAPAGEYTISGDKKFECEIYDWTKPLSVESFSMDPMEGDSVKVHTKATYDEDTYFDWYIYAQRTDTQLGNGRMLLTQTSGYTNREDDTTLDVSDLPDGTYTLSMEAVITLPSELEVTASATLDKELTISGHTQPGDESKIDLCLNLTDGILELDWSAIEDTYDQMYVGIAAADGTPLYENTFERDIQKDTANIDLAGGDVTVVLRPIYRESFAAEYTRLVPVKPVVTMSIDTPEATGDLMMSVHYQAGSETIPVRISMGDKSEVYRVNGEGDLSVPLELGDNNEVEVRYTVAAGLSYSVLKTITVQNLPPVIYLYGVEDRILTSDKKVTLRGKTDLDAKLTVNGEAVELLEGGAFQIEVPLEKGENLVELVSENTYGIKATRTVQVICGDGYGSAAGDAGKGLPNKWLMIGGAGLLTFLILVLVGLRGRKKGYGIVRMLWALLQTVPFLAMLYAAGGAGYAFYRYQTMTDTIRGNDLISVLETGTYNQITDTLMTRTAWKTMGTRLMIVAWICLIVWIILLVIANRIGGGSKAPEMPEAGGLPEVDTGEAQPTPDPEDVPTEEMPRMRYCPECGAEVDPNGVFCGNCGHKF